MKREKRRVRARVAIVLAALAGLLIVWKAAGLLSSDADQRAISFERWKRFTAYSAGYTLPGTPDLAGLDARLSEKGLKLGSPVFIRIFKREFELELWMQREGKFELFATYPICRWSGKLGPKIKQGDKQAPEGFYTVGATQLNPESRWHRSFNLGFPNLFDRAHSRTGSFLMVHGGCSSVGCYAMTNAVIDEIWKIVTSALEKGQDRFQVQAFPFRMTADNLMTRSRAPSAQFWRDLKMGYDMFEVTRRPPQIGVCSGRYTFEPAALSQDGSAPIANRCFRLKSSS